MTDIEVRAIVGAPVDALVNLLAFQRCPTSVVSNPGDDASSCELLALLRGDPGVVARLARPSARR
jgi:hypothetical protein